MALGLSSRADSTMTEQCPTAFSDGDVIKTTIGEGERGGGKCQGVEVPRPLAFAREKVHPIGYQTLEYYRRLSITQVGRCGDTRETKVPENPPVDDRDLGAGRGRKMGGKRARETVVEAVTWCGEQRRATESGW